MLHLCLTWWIQTCMKWTNSYVTEKWLNHHYQIGAKPPFIKLEKASLSQAGYKFRLGFPLPPTLDSAFYIYKELLVPYSEWVSTISSIPAKWHSFWVPDWWVVSRGTAFKGLCTVLPWITLVETDLFHFKSQVTWTASISCFTIFSISKESLKQRWK